MQTRQLWYTRRGSEVRGPFPAGQITRFILLGRIRECDELSADQQTWQPVSEVPVLIPEEMKGDLQDAAAYERLMIARMREDERTARDRRGEDEITPAGVPRDRRRSDDDRRAWEEAEMLRHREIKTAITEAAKHSKQNYFLRGAVAALLLAAVVGSALYFQPWEEHHASDCNAIPQPWVNWSNCFMEGVQLVSMDLRGSRLRNANLTGADLRGSQFTGADLAYANLSVTNLTDVDLQQATLVGTNLRKSNLSGANLTGANMPYAILQNANLSNVRFVDADLSNADLRGATLENTDFTGANLSQARWLDGRVCKPNSRGSCEH